MEKYDSGLETEVRGWIQTLLNESIPAGPAEVQKSLKSGITLIKYVTSHIINIVNRSRPRLTSYLLKKQARHQCDVFTPSSDCLVVYNQFVTLKKCLAATVNKFLRSRQENINKWKFESSWYEHYKRRPFCLNFWSLLTTSSSPSGHEVPERYPVYITYISRIR